MARGRLTPNRKADSMMKVSGFLWLGVPDGIMTVAEGAAPVQPFRVATTPQEF